MKHRKGSRGIAEIRNTELEIADGHRTVFLRQCGTPTGPLKSIGVERLDPADGACVCITFIAEQDKEPDEEETAVVYLNADDLDAFIQMLQRDQPN